VVHRERKPAHWEDPLLVAIKLARFNVHLVSSTSE